MKKILLTSLLVASVALSACTKPAAPTSFQGLYQKSIEAKVATMDKFMDDLGIRKYESITDGTLTSHLTVPEVLSGALSATYDGNVNGTDSQMTFRNIKLDFFSPVSSGALSADEFGVVSKGGDAYILYKNFVDAGMMTDEVKKVIKEYEGTWLSINDTRSLSGEELIGANFGKNLVTKSPKELGKYFIDYPVFKDTADLGMSGALHVWAVELDRANISKLAQKMYSDLGGTGMTTEQVQKMEASLAATSFSGKLGFDPAEPKAGMLDGVFSQSGKALIELTGYKTANSADMKMVTLEDGVTLNFKANTQGEQTNFDIVGTQSGSELMKLVGVLTRDDHKIKELSLEGSSRGIVISMKHTNSDNGFVGKLTTPAGTLDWSGSRDDGKLKSLKVVGASPFGSLDMDLKPIDDSGMIKGPLVISYGQEKINATIGLQMEKAAFGFILDTLYQGLPVHFDLMSKGKVSDAKKDIAAPTSSKSFKELTDKINALSPPATPSANPTYESEHMSDDFIPTTTGSVALPQ